MRPIIGITMGDPAGCGPEITIKALSDPALYERCRPVVIGDARCLRAAIGVTGHGELTLHPIRSIGDALYEFGTVDVYDLELADPADFKYGKVSALCGEAAFTSGVTAIELAKQGEIMAIVTNALNKEAINLAGHHFSGHTEILAHYTGTDKFTMMLAHEALRVVHVSTHVSMREACDRVKKQRVLDVIRIANKAMLDLGLEAPKVGVCGLNPHAGENGLFGREEIEEIRPAIEEACAEGIQAFGPLPSDTAFSKALGGWYDVMVCMYHDQGHIPLKVRGFHYNRETGRWDDVSGVNITLGLPIIRTSVDHGTAFGHAGTGVASEISLVNAIDYAIRFAEKKFA